MPFKEPFETYYAAIIRPAVEESNLTPVRADSIFRPSPIIADIWQMIQDADLVVAELTEKNANVFYELGLAHAIGKPVILISETMADVPFDLQSLRVILYDKNFPDWGQRLHRNLLTYIAATVADTLSAIPSIFRTPVKSQAPPESEVNIRLSALEQQVSSLRRGPDLSRPPASYNEFIDLFRHLPSDIEGSVLAARALGDWAISENFVKQGLEERFGKENVARILRNAKRLVQRVPA